MKVVVIFDNFGPYHLARLNSSACLVDLLGVEVAGRSCDYSWSISEWQIRFKKETLCAEGISCSLASAERRRRLNSVLERFRPEVIFVPGWSSATAFHALRWAVGNGVPAVAMSETTSHDGPRQGFKEWIKRRIVGLCSAALVGGSRHAEYMAKLGMPKEKIYLGYDVVDNDYFQRRAEEVRAQSGTVRTEYNLPENYFLGSARFIEKKNLHRLIRAYALYQASAAIGRPWDLVLLGEGQLRAALEAQVSGANLRPHVHLPGFKQYSELPLYYGCAGAFIHASTIEQWGLVVNEAMASGLPVLVSNRCDCAPDLVQAGENGFTFDPFDVEQMAHLMAHVAHLGNERRTRMGMFSQRIISQWGPEQFAAGVKLAAETAMATGPKHAGTAHRVMVHALSRR